MPHAQYAIGRRGEEIAAWFLTRAGCTVLNRNVRIEADELDLVVRHRRSVVVVEVKASARGYDPFEAFDDHKLMRLERIAVRYPVRVDRIDLVGISVGVRDEPMGLTIRWLQGIHR